MLLDSNIIIYAAEPDCEWLRKRLEGAALATSIVSRVEVLGFHGLNPSAEKELGEFFSGVRVLPLSDAIADRAIQLRRRNKMGLADAVIAATALEHGLPLVTRNVEDFRNVEGLELTNPFPAN